MRLITQRLGDRRVGITIRDHGVGIADEDLPRIFDPYFTTRRAGTGLGLAIAKNIIDGLGGTIGVTTRPGDGTDFRIELGDAPVHHERLTMAGSILLADDEEKILKTLGRALRDDGHDVVTTSNARDAAALPRASGRSICW